MAQFVATTNDVGPEHHGRALHIDKGVASQLLLARFAMLVLGRLTKFLDFYRKIGVLAVLVRKDIEVMEYVEPLKEADIDAIFAEPKRANSNTPGGRSGKRSRVGSPRQAAGGVDESKDDHALATPYEYDSNVATSQPSSSLGASMPPSPAVVQDGGGIRASDRPSAAGGSGALTYRRVSPPTLHYRKRRCLSVSSSSAVTWTETDVDLLHNKMEQLKKAQDYNERRLRRHVYGDCLAASAKTDS